MYTFNAHVVNICDTDVIYNLYIKFHCTVDPPLFNFQTVHVYVTADTVQEINTVEMFPF